MFEKNFYIYAVSVTGSRVISVLSKLDLSNRLLEIDANLCNQIKEILKQHIDTRHIKGGESTRNKFLLKKNE